RPAPEPADMRRGARQPPPSDQPRRWRRRRDDAADGRLGGRSSDGDAGGANGERAGETDRAAEQERLIVEALADLRDMDVREVMTPRVDVVALTIPVHAEDVARAVRESGHSCFPVIDDDLDDVVGVLFVNDLFRKGRPSEWEKSLPSEID